MYELVQVGPRSYYINAPVKIGVYLAEENQVYLIDSGNDKDAGRNSANCWKSRDGHCGPFSTPILTQTTLAATSTFGKQTGCKIYAPGVDCAFTRHPLLEPSFLYGGFPPKGLAAQVFDGQGESCRVSHRCRALPKGVDLLSPSLAISSTWLAFAVRTVWFILPTAYPVRRPWRSIKLASS